MDVIELADGGFVDCADYPLPDGIDDCVLNQAQLAKALGTSTVSISSWIRDDMPVLQQGGNGKSYEFQLSHCYAWKMHRDKSEANRRQAGDDAAQQMALHFLNDDEGLANRETLTAKDVKEYAEAELRRNQAAEQRGELVRTSRVTEVLEQIIVDFVSGVNVIPDYAEAEFGITPQQAEKLQARCDAIIDETRLTLERNHLGGARVVGMGAVGAR